jgi:hypothetical protein
MATSSIYETLKSTAEKFVHSPSFSKSDAGPDQAAIRALCTDDYTQSWGHEYFISSRPHLNRTLDFNGFMAHLNSMTSKLESAEAEITNITIDERQRKVVVRATISLRPKGSAEVGTNDLVWILGMNERGDKVQSGQEFVDADAAMRLGQLIRESNVTN